MHENSQLPETLLNWLRNDALTIYLFHGVIRKQQYSVRNYTGKHIQLDLFSQCMKKLAHVGHVLSMDEILAFHQNNQPLPPRAFAITFDDGFENNLSVAAPVLSDLNLPFTIYVTTDFIDRNSMSWIDRIELAVEIAEGQTLECSWLEQSFAISDVESRVALLKKVRAYVKNSPGCDANQFADTFCEMLGVSHSFSSDDPIDLKMNWNQVRQANQSKSITIGGHSHTHSILSFLTSEKLNFEIDQSLFLLRENAGIEATHYSYPEGLAHCYSESVITALKQRGVRCCPTAIPGVNSCETDPFHLRRVMVA